MKKVSILIAATYSIFAASKDIKISVSSIKVNDPDAGVEVYQTIDDFIGMVYAELPKKEDIVNMKYEYFSYLNKFENFKTDKEAAYFMIHGDLKGVL